MWTKKQHSSECDTRQMVQGFAVFAAIVLLIRIVSLWFNTSDLFFDEAQYWSWGKEPAFGYFSKPPVLAWILGGFTSICGDSEFCTRLPSALIHTATGLIIAFIGNQLYNARIGYLAGVTWLLLPAVSLSSTLISTDVPLLFFWSLGMLGFIRFEKRNDWCSALLFGFALGAGLNAKYAMAYMVFCVIVFALSQRQNREILKRPKFWIAILIGLTMLIPNIIWNFQHKFATVSHTGDNIGWGNGFPHFDRLAEFLGAQFGVAGPIIFGVYLIALVRLYIEGASHNQRLLICFSLPILLLISFQALMSKAFANWAATAIPAMVLLISELFVTRMAPFWKKLSFAIHAFVFLGLAVIVGFAGPGQLLIPENKNPFKRLWGGHELGHMVQAELAKGGYDYVLSANRKFSASLIYYLRDQSIDVVAFRSGEKPRDHFELTRAIQDKPTDLIKDKVFLYPSGFDGVPNPISGKCARSTRLSKSPLYKGSDKFIYLFKLEGCQFGR